MSKLIGIPANYLPDAWPEIEPFLTRLAANSGGRFTVSAFAAAVAQKDMQLWAEIDNGEPIAAGLTELINYPGKRVARFIGVNGARAAEWAAHISQVERWAHIAGASDMEILAPIGWEFHLRKYGYKRTHVMLEKPL